MAWPIIASTTTTLAAFFPLIFWPGIVGEFMKFLPITLVAVLSASLLMALIFVPTLGSLFGSVGGSSTSASLSPKFDTASEQEDISAFSRSYKRILEKALNNPGKVMIVRAVFMLVGSIYLFRSRTRLQFFPDIEPETANIYVRARGNMQVDT